MNKPTYQIKGFPIIKFQSKERLESLQKGLIYANKLKYYRDLEKQTGDATIGDSFDGLFHINEGKIKLINTDEEIDLNDQLIETSASNDYVFCMFGIPEQTVHFQFSEEQRTHMKSFGDSALIILDSKAFIERVTEAAKAQGYTALLGRVNYIDANNDYANVFLSMQEDIRNVALWKRNMYEYQKECRFIFSPGKADVDHLELQIGDISDISVIVPAENALTAVVDKCP